MPNYAPEITGVIVDLEESLLGAIMLHAQHYRTRAAINEVMSILKPSDFRGYIHTHRPDQWIWRSRVYYAMTLCDLPPTELNVAVQLQQMNMLHNNDCSLLAHCIYVCPCSLDYMQYAKQLKDFSVKQQVKYHADKGDLRKVRQLATIRHRKGFEI